MHHMNRNTLLATMANVTNITADIPNVLVKRNIAQISIAASFLILTICVAIVGNIAVIAVVCSVNTFKRDKSNILLVNLSVTDLASASLVMMSALVSIAGDGWPFGRAWCDIVCALNYCFIIVTMLTMCFISIDRYFAVLHPLRYKSRISKMKFMLAIAYTWFQGIAFACIPLVFQWVEYDYWEAICAIQWQMDRIQAIYYVITAFLLCFLGPGIIIIYCYVKILGVVKQQKQDITASSQSDNTICAARRLDAKARMMCSLLVVVFAFFICMTPFSVTKLIKVMVIGDDVVPGTINLTSSLLGYMSSAVNPLIYGIFRREFRAAYKNVLCFRHLVGTANRTGQISYPMYMTKVQSISRPASN